MEADLRVGRAGQSFPLLLNLHLICFVVSRVGGNTIQVYSHLEPEEWE
jgi:hypothetical protein